MPTVEDLGRAWKAKYPGAYDHASDLEVGRAVQKKYPGGYDHLEAGTPERPTAGAGQTPAGAGPSERFGQSFWSKIDPAAGLSALAEATAHPVDALKAIGTAQAKVGQEAVESFGRGEYGRGIRQGLNFMLPVVGPEFEASAQQMERGDVAGGLGSMAGTFANFGVPELARRTQGVPVIPKVQNLNPVEAKAVQYALSEGVPVPAGTATGNRFVNAAQKLSAYSPIGSMVAPLSERATERGLTRVGNQLADRAYPGQRILPEGAGTEVRGALKTQSDDFFTQADQAYAPWHQAEAHPSSLRKVQQAVDPDGNPIYEDVAMPVDVRQLKDDILPLYLKLNRAWEPARKYASQGLQAMKSIIEGKDFISSSDAELSLGGLKRMSREDPEGIAGGAVARQIIPKLQQDVDDAVRSVNPRVLPGLRAGRTLTRRAHEVKEVLDDLLTEPVQAYGQMTYRQDAAIGRLRNIEREAPGTLPKVGRAFLERLLEQATQEGGFIRSQGILKAWQDLGPETKKLLFPDPTLRDNIGDFLLSAKKISENPNPPGTALVGAVSALGTKALENPFAAAMTILGSGAVAKLLYSPAGAKLLTRGARLPLGDPAAYSLWTTQLMRQAGQDSKKQKAAAAQ